MNVEFMEKLKPALCEECDVSHSDCNGENETFCTLDIARAYEKGRADERPKAFAKGYDSGYQKGKADALDHCDRCETDQWDALYKAEMKGREDAIEEMKKMILPMYCSCCNQIACDGGQVGSIQECASVSLLRDVVFDLADELIKGAEE